MQLLQLVQHLMPNRLPILSSLSLSLSQKPPTSNLGGSTADPQAPRSISSKVVLFGLARGFYGIHFSLARFVLAGCKAGVKDLSDRNLPLMCLARSAIQL